MAKLKIRLDANGEPESYDPDTGKTVGHISTMGNMNKQTKEDIERDKANIEQIKKEYGL